MQLETTLGVDRSNQKSLPEHLLTAERILMGLVLVTCGVVGCFNLLVHPTAIVSAAQLNGTVFKAGFMLPLLKGAEVLLQLWANRVR